MVHRPQDPGDTAGMSDDVVLPHMRTHTQAQSHLYSSPSSYDAYRQHQGKDQWERVYVVYEIFGVKISHNP